MKGFGMMGDRKLSGSQGEMPLLFFATLLVIYNELNSTTIWFSHPPRGRPEWGFKKPEPDSLRGILVLINRNRILIFPIRFLIDRNRNFERSIRFLINRNRNSGWLPDFRFLIWFGHLLSLGAGMFTRYKHAYSQNEHIQHIHTCLILLTTAVYAHSSQLFCLSLFAGVYLP